MSKHPMIPRFSLFLAAACLAGAQDPTVLLKNWPAPLYFQLPAVEKEDAAKDVNLAAADTMPQARALADMTAPMVFVGIVPCRVADTRLANGPLGGPIMGGGSTRTFPILSSACGIPATAKAYSFNVTVVPSGGLGYLTIWPTGQPQPYVSTLNSLDGQIVANAAVVPSGTSGNIDVFVTNTTHVIIDVNGYYMPPSTLALGSGSSLHPAITFPGSTSTGIFAPSSSSVAISSGGSTRLTVNDDGIDVNGDADISGNILKSGTKVFSTSTSNTGIGYGSLVSYGSNGNTAVGANVMPALGASGSNNTALGYRSMNAMTDGTNNASAGAWSMLKTTTGARNVVMGVQAMNENLAGEENTVLGYQAGYHLMGSENTAVGTLALHQATGLTKLVGVGWNALRALTTGERNSAFGYRAGAQLTSGSRNTMLGDYAGWYVTSGSDNAYIASWGNQSYPSESNTMRVGQSGYHNRAFIAGIRGVSTGVANAIPVYIDSNHQLGTASSSRRVKTDIHDMGDTTGMLMALRPVSFRYKLHGPNSPLQFGLVAEEVAEVAPDLTARDQNGEIETVFYDKVNAMLLNEVQKQHRLIESQRQMLLELRNVVDQLRSQSRPAGTTP